MVVMIQCPSTVFSRYTVVSTAGSAVADTSFAETVTGLLKTDQFLTGPKKLFSWGELIS